MKSYWRRLKIRNPWAIGFRLLNKGELGTPKNTGKLRKHPPNKSSVKSPLILNRSVIQKGAIHTCHGHELAQNHLFESEK